MNPLLQHLVRVLSLGLVVLTSAVLPPGIFPATTTTTTTTSTTIQLIEEVTPTSTSTTTSTTPPTVTRPPTTRTPSTLAAAPADDIWWQLALCEDGGKNRDYGQYSGYFHFLPSTYHAYGGTGQPSDDDYATQLAVAQRLQAAEGWNPWPGCKRKLGL